jgi:hypothetical protein
MAKFTMTAEEVGAIISYDPDSGLFSWKQSTSKRIKVGMPAGSLRSDGYLEIEILGQRARAHRLAWLLTTGEFPKFDIDHLNGNRADNRFSNLRDVPRKTNLENQREGRGKQKTLGVYWNKKDRRYMARITTSGKMIYLGSFKTSNEAHAAYLSAKRMLHVGCMI